MHGVIYKLQESRSVYESPKRIEKIIIKKQTVLIKLTWLTGNFNTKRRFPLVSPVRVIVTSTTYVLK